MDSRKFIISNDEKMEDPSNGSDSSKTDSQGHSEMVERNSTRTLEENLSSVGELESENQGLPSVGSVKVSCQLSNQSPTLSSDILNINLLDESTLFYSSQEFCNLINHTMSEGAPITPRPNPPTTSVSVGEVSGSKTVQSNLSPFSAKHNSDFSSPPDSGAIPGIKSFSRNLKETNTPSPEKRSVETDVGSTPTKRLKKTPESHSSKHETETESHRSKLSLPAAAKASCKSPTNLQIELFKAAIQKTEKSDSLNTSSPPIDETIAKNRSDESKAEDDPCLSIVQKSPTNLQMHGAENAVQNDEPSTEKNTLISFRNNSTDPNSLSESCNPVELLQTESFLVLRKGQILLKELESTVSVKESVRLSALDVSFESEQSDYSVKEFKSAVHPSKVMEPPPVGSPKLDETSSSNSENSQNSTAAGFESCNKVKKTQDSVSAKETQSNSATETEILKPQSIPLILNPHLPSSCPFRQWSTSVFDAPRRILEFETSNNTLRNKKNQSDAATQTSTPDTDSRSRLKELPVSQSRGMHERSLSDRTPASKYSSEGYQSNISRRTFSRLCSRESLAPCSPGIRRRSVSEGSVTCRNLTEDQLQRNQHNSLIRSQSKMSSSSSRSLPEISKVVGLFRGVTHTSSSNDILATNNSSPTVRNNTEEQTPLNIGNSLRQKMHVSFLSCDASTSRNRPEGGSDTKPPPVYVSEGQPLTSMFQPIVASSSFDQASTSRFQPIVTSHSYFDQVSTSRFQPVVTSSSFDQVYISRNQSGVSGDINPPPMDVLGQPSTSRFQTVGTEDVTFNQAHFSESTSRNVFDRYVPMFEKFSAVAGSFSSDDQHDVLSGISIASSDAPPSRQAREATEPTRDDEFLEYTDEARIILKAVLKKMMVHNGDICIWLRIECEEDNMKQCFLLTRYLANRGYKLWGQNLFTTHRMTAEARVEITYEKLISTVVSTLVLILRGTIARNYTAFFHNYMNFSHLTRDFALYSGLTNLEDAQDEVSRNRMEKLVRMMHTFLLRTSLAFRLILMYIGEKRDEVDIERYGSLIREEDSMFLRRKYIF